MFSSAIQRLNDRRNGVGEAGEDAGFTLIELMVVLLILAILLAIAIPTFLGVTKSANDRAAQSNLNTAMLNAKAAYQSNSQTYTGVTVATLTAAEPGLSFVSTASTAQNVVSVFPTADGNAIVLASYSKSNNCFYQIDNPGGNTAVAAPFAANFQVNGVTVASGTVATPGAGAITFPTATAGTIYVEVKGDTNSAHCNASTPVYGGTSFEWLTTQFPSL